MSYRLCPRRGPSTFELLKADAANAGVENMGNEIVKLGLLRSGGAVCQDADESAALAQTAGVE
jgi:hypothetical protein